MKYFSFLMTVLCACVASFLVYSVVYFVCWLGDITPLPIKTAGVECFIGKKYYSAYGKYNPTRNTFLESGTNLTRFLPKESCLITYDPKYVEAK
jgi:hypothetical protein